jgi:hypothetical protein
MTKTKRKPQTQKTATTKSDPITTLLHLVACAQLHRGAGGRPFARVPVDDRFEFYELQSAAFRNWLVDAYVFQYNQAPSRCAISRVVSVLEARAQFHGSLPSVHIRVAGDAEGDQFVSYLDLCDSQGRAVEIRPGEWSIVERPRLYFRRAPGMTPLPLPESGGTINLLRPYVNLGELDFRLFVAWLTAAIRPVGPYPPLVICGEQGSTKTTLAKIARLLIDPHSTPLLSEPTGTRDLMITATNSWLLAFDNVGQLPGWLSDCFCRLAVGGGYATRTLYTDNQITYLHAQRPLILNGISNFVTRGDLIDRALFLNLHPVHPADRRTESELWSAFRFDYPRILGSVLDTIAGALRILPTLELDEVPRMADFAFWGEAVGQSLGWPEQSFRSAYARNRRAATDNSIDDSAVAQVLLGAVPSSLKWSGPITALHRQLTQFAGNKVARSKLWPRNISQLCGELRRLSPQLRERGLAIAFSRSRDQRLITLTFDNNWLLRRPHGTDRLT